MKDETLPNERDRVMAISQACVNVNLRKATRIVSGFYDEILQSTGLHGNQLVLLVVPYLAGPVSINKMAAHVGLDRTTLVRNLKHVEARGLVTIKAGDDLRTRIVTLTPEGRETLIQALPLWEAAQRQVVELLGKHHDALMDGLAVFSSLEQAP